MPSTKLPKNLANDVYSNGITSIPNLKTGKVSKLVTTSLQVGSDNSIENLQVTGGISAGFRIVEVISGNSYTIPDSISILHVKAIGSSGNVSIILPANPLKGQMFYIKDASGIAATVNIRIYSSSNSIEGNSYIEITDNYGSKQLSYADGWYVIGANGTGSAGGNGGAGVTTSISGTSTTYAGGGGGSIITSPTFGVGGSGGGGAGGKYNDNNGVAGTANTGGGAGGASGASAAPAGGSGIVIVRYLKSVVGL